MLCDQDVKKKDGAEDDRLFFHPENENCARNYPFFSWGSPKNACVERKTQSVKRRQDKWIRGERNVGVSHFRL